MRGSKCKTEVNPKRKQMSAEIRSSYDSFLPVCDNHFKINKELLGCFLHSSQLKRKKEEEMQRKHRREKEREGEKIEETTTRVKKYTWMHMTSFMVAVKEEKRKRKSEPGPNIIITLGWGTPVTTTFWLFFLLSPQKKLPKIISQLGYKNKVVEKELMHLPIT
jgi:hypothetical protein